ncbi:MAG TPA: type 4a pilus biogenesis protein PilO [Bacillota bacterium]
MNTPKDKGQYLGPTIVLGVFLLAVSGGFILHQQNRNLARELHKKEAQLSSARRQLRSYRSNDTQKRRIELEHLRLEEFIPSRENQEEMIMELGQLAQKYNLKISRCVLNPKTLILKELPQYQASQWLVELNGDYQGLTNFLAALPQGSRLILVSGMEIASVAQSDLNGQPLDAEYQLDARVTLDLISNLTEKVSP